MEAIEEKKGVILTAGLKTQYNTFNQIQDLVRIQPKTQSPNIVSSMFNSSFDLFDVSEETENYIRKLPPLTGIFGDYEITGQGQALLYQEIRSEEHTSELQSRGQLVCRLLLEKKKTK